MAFPCSTSSSPNLANLLVATPSLQGGDASLPSSDPTPGTLASATFDNVLSGLKPSAVPPKEAGELADPTSDDSDEAESTTTAPTVDQLAMIAGLMMIPPLPAPVPPAQLAPATADANMPSLSLMGAQGRSVPELLASGAETLEYTIAPAASAVLPTETPVSGNDVKAPAPSAETAKAVVPGTLTSATAPSSDAQSVAATPVENATSASVATAPLTISPSVRAKSPTAETAVPVETGTSALSSNAAAETTSPTAASATSENAATATDAALTQMPDRLAEATGAQTIVSPKAVAKDLPKSRSAGTAEKTAALPTDGARSGAYPSIVLGKNRVQAAGDKELKADLADVGTLAANWGKSMYQDLRNFAAAGFPSDFSTGVAATGSAAATTNHSLVSASHAADLVHEIHEIADGLWAVERNSVEVKFNFGEQERLSVRVEYRDGTVNATFRTDSPHLRDAIAREWQNQSAATEQRPYRMAEPVFSGSSGNSGSFGGDASRQQRSSEQPAPAERFHLGALPRSASSMTAPAVPSTSSRPEITGRLHAIA